MLKTYKKVTLAAAACTLLGISASGAAVTMTFAQVGPNVTATWSGSYDLPAGGKDLGLGGNSIVGPNSAIYSEGGITWGLSVHGTSPQTTLVFTPGLYQGAPFGFFFGQILVFPANSPVGPFSPLGQFTFQNKTLASLGAASFANTLAFTGMGNDPATGSREIRFTTAGIPEPSGLVLLALGAMGLATRRQRKQAV